MVGVDAGPLTLRQLVWMADARSEGQWVRTSAVLAMLANANRDPKKKPSPYKPNDFNPYAHRRDRPASRQKAPVSVLKGLFVKKA